MSRKLSSHLNDQGEATMIDVGGKTITTRVCRAEGRLRMKESTLARLRASDVPKGDALAAARVAGILAAKRTPELVPLCHPVRLTSVEIGFLIDEAEREVTILATARAEDRTGVEMEALTAVSVAALTLYDMLKGIDDELVIGDLRVVEKRGGKHDFVRDDA